MLFALGAASSAIDLLKSLTSSKTSQAKPAGQTQDAGKIFDISGSASASTGAAPSSGSAGSSAPIAPETMSALLDAQSQASTGTGASTKSRSDALNDLFGQIDGDGDGNITKSEFEDALGAGGTNLAKADDVFSKLDKDGDGNVTLGEMSSALRGGARHHSHHAGGGGGGNADALMQALDGTSTSVTNSDGSVTTTTTYADGSKVTATSAANPSAAGAATSSYNFVDRLVQRYAVDQLVQQQAKPISAQAWASLSVNA
ncbi:EF-hand domain-containing protein [Bradyrhizobium sp. BRP22]|uniref:EF-hand domain-containing protein n=1 Tax=Bradyrhizobium sp. BRP22 TaxID=2793821 RepID=UPI001CD61F15|nr:EF-hand domain-containing protein [Bradyrhizobium sp. BRP22]MCA1455401.1 EF-hand domain-containing protein [Bradyrhizobium sp. BRP22]